jgi:hypothetical protein
MNWATIIPLVIKYGPLILSFIQTQGPGIHTFIQEVETAIKGAKNADGTINWAELLPVLFKYAPELFTFASKEGVPFQTLISDIMAALRGQTVTNTPVPLVLPSSGFVFPPKAA